MTAPPDRTTAAPQAALPPHVRRRSLTAILVCITVCGAGWGMSLLLLPIVMERAGVSGSLIGWNTAIGGLATVVLPPMFPFVLRRLGFIGALALSLALCIGSLLVFHGTSDLTVWFAARFVLGVGLTGMFTATETWLNLMAEEHYRGKVLGLYGTGLAGGFALGTGTVALVGSQGFAPFGVTILIFILGGLALLPARGISPRIETLPGLNILSILRSAPTPMAAAIVFGAIEMGILSLIAVYGLRAGMAEPEAALMATVIAVGNLVFQVPLGALSDRIDRRLMLTMCAGGSLVSAVAIPLSLGTPALLYPVLFLFGGAVVGIYTIGLTALGEHFRGATLPMANAAFVMMYGFGNLFGPPVTGAAMDVWNPHGLMAMLGLFCGVYLVLPAREWLNARRRARSGAGNPARRR
ncbi:MAG: MFS transporter [Alphaproteobacteria bacterium]